MFSIWIGVISRYIRLFEVPHKNLWPHVSIASLSVVKLKPCCAEWIFLLSSRQNDAKEPQTEGPSSELQTTEGNGDLLVTLDVRGYAPTDITVKLEGRSLAVVAMKQAGAEESQSCSSSSSCSSFSSCASSQMGFARRIDLPDRLDLSGLSCSLMDDGQLRIYAPVAKQPISEERQMPIRYRTSLEFPISKEKTEEQKD